MLTWCVTCDMVQADQVEETESLPQAEEHKQIIYRYIPIDKEFFEWDELYDKLYDKKQKNREQTSDEQPKKKRKSYKTYPDYFNYDHPAYTTEKTTTFRLPVVYTRDSSHFEYHEDYDEEYSEDYHEDHDASHRVTSPAPRRNTKSKDRIHASVQKLTGPLQSFRWPKIKLPSLEHKKRKYKKNIFNIKFSTPQFITQEMMSTFLYRLAAFTLFSVLLIFHIANALVSDPWTWWNDVFRRSMGRGLTSGSEDSLTSLLMTLHAVEQGCLKYQLCRMAHQAQPRLTNTVIGATLLASDSNESALNYLQNVGKLYRDIEGMAQQDWCSLTFDKCSR